MLAANPPRTAAPDLGVTDRIFAGGPMITLARLVLLIVALLIVVACVYAIASIVVRSIQ